MRARNRYIIASVACAAILAGAVAWQNWPRSDPDRNIGNQVAQSAGEAVSDLTQPGNVLPVGEETVKPLPTGEMQPEVPESTEGLQSADEQSARPLPDRGMESEVLDLQEDALPQTDAPGIAAEQPLDDALPPAH